MHPHGGMRTTSQIWYSAKLWSFLKKHPFVKSWPASWRLEWEKREDLSSMRFGRMWRSGSVLTVSHSTWSRSWQHVGQPGVRQPLGRVGRPCGGSCQKTKALQCFVDAAHRQHPPKNKSVVVPKRFVNHSQNKLARDWLNPPVRSFPFLFLSLPACWPIIRFEPADINKYQMGL